MIFTLEALEAKHGDALLLHYGTRTERRLIVIDGGPSGVYTKTIKPRLLALKKARSPDAPLPIELLMVSHIDDDHIRGVLDLVEDLVDLRGNQEEQPFDVQALWHNSFEDLTGAKEAEFIPFATAVRRVALRRDISADLPLTPRGALILASVAQGRTLRGQARALGLTVRDLVMFRGTTGDTVRVGSGLTLRILGPSAQRVAALRRQWIEALKRKVRVSAVEWHRLAADYVDSAVANLSSLVVIARQGNHSMLLTGDARGDDILTALVDAKLLERGRFHVDLLKLPHHGSDRNVATEFFRTVTADHYVISADGRFGNPEVATLKMIAEARGNAAYTVHLTNGIPRVASFVKRQKARGGRMRVIQRRREAPSVKVDLAERLNE